MVFQPPERIKVLPPYLFVEIDSRKRAAIAAGKDVIDFGVGDPDQPTHGFILDRLSAALRHPPNHRYPRDEGIPAFREQAAAFFRRRYGVELDPQRELYALIGTKEGLGHLPLAVVNPGQTVLLPDPAYPVYRSAAIFAGGVPWMMALTQSNGWLPDLDAIPAEVAESAALIVLNYPNNPTGAVAPREFYDRVVAFAQRHSVVVAQDAAYNEMYYDGRPPSILQVPGAREVAVELHSCSKTFNMAGWRIGFVAGNAEVIAALARIKANIDCGPPNAIQEAAAEAFAGVDRPEIARVRALYHERAEVLFGGLRELGFRVLPPKATMFVWAGVPSGYDSMRLASKILDEAAVVVVPGVGFGKAGEGYVRFALSVEVERIRVALARLRELRW